MKTVAAGDSPVPGKEMPISACLLSPGTVDDAAHDSDVERFHAWIFLSPNGHGVGEIALNFARQFLKYGGSRAPATRARGDLRSKRSKAHGLQDFLRDFHFQSAIAVRFGRQRNADRVANSFLQQNPQRGREATMPFEPIPASVRPRCSA